MSLLKRISRLSERRRARRLKAGLAQAQRTSERPGGVPATGSAPRDGGGQVDVGFTS